MEYKVIDSVMVNGEFRELDLSDSLFEENINNSYAFQLLKSKVDSLSAGGGTGGGSTPTTKAKTGIATVYKQYFQTPTKPFGGTYDYQRKTLTTPPSGWSVDFVEETNKLSGKTYYFYQSIGLFTEGEDPIWTDPVKYLRPEDIVDASATNTVSHGALIFKATADETRPDKPRTAVEADFDYATKTLINVPEGWALSPEEAMTETEKVVWQTSCTFLYDTKDKVKFNRVTDWTTPILYLDINKILLKAKDDSYNIAVERVEAALGDLADVNTSLENFREEINASNEAALNQLNSALNTIDTLVLKAESASREAKELINGADQRLQGVIDDFNSEKDQLVDGVKVLVDSVSVLYEWVLYQGTEVPNEETLVESRPDITSLEDLNSKLTGKEYYNKFYQLNGELYKYITTSAAITSEIAALKADGTFLKTKLEQTEASISSMAERLQLTDTSLELAKSEWTLTADGIRSTVDAKIEKYDADTKELLGLKTSTSTWQQTVSQILSSVATQETVGDLVTTKLAQSIVDEDGIFNRALNEKIEPVTTQINGIEGKYDLISQLYADLNITAQGIQSSVSDIQQLKGEAGNLIRQEISTSVSTLTSLLIKDEIDHALYDEETGKLSEIESAVRILTADGVQEKLTKLSGLPDNLGEVTADLEALINNPNIINDLNLGEEFQKEHPLLFNLSSATLTISTGLIAQQLSETEISQAVDGAIKNNLKLSHIILSYNTIESSVSNLTTSYNELDNAVKAFENYEDMPIEEKNTIAVKLGYASYDDLIANNGKFVYTTEKFTKAVSDITESSIELKVLEKVEDKLNGVNLENEVKSAVQSIVAGEIRSQVTSEIGTQIETGAINVLKNKLHFGTSSYDLATDVDENGNIKFKYNVSLDIDGESLSISANAAEFVITGKLISDSLFAHSLQLTDDNGITRTSIERDGEAHFGMIDQKREPNKEDGSSLFRIDGSGYLAGGKIEWKKGFGDKNNNPDEFGLVVNGHIQANSGRLGSSENGWTIGVDGLIHDNTATNSHVQLNGEGFNCTINGTEIWNFNALDGSIILGGSTAQNSYGLFGHWLDGKYVLKLNGILETEDGTISGWNISKTGLCNQNVHIHSNGNIFAKEDDGSEDATNPYWMLSNDGTAQFSNGSAKFNSNSFVLDYTGSNSIYMENGGLSVYEGSKRKYTVSNEGIYDSDEHRCLFYKVFETEDEARSYSVNHTEVLCLVGEDLIISGISPTYTSVGLRKSRNG